MLRSAMLFGLGVLVFHQLARLPGGHWLAAELALLPVLLFVVRSPGAAALLLGFAWSHAYALATLPATFADDDRVMRLVATGRVVSLPELSRNPTRFVFLAETIETTAEGSDPPLAGRWRLHLSWRDPPALATGDVWRLPLRLRRAHGFATPGAWDYEGWLYWQGIRYTGYVSTDSEPQRLATAACCALTRLRGGLSAAIDTAPISAFARGVIRAVTVGDRSGLSRDAQDLFRATGTSHLMAISGLHVGLVGGLGLVGISALWRRLPRLCARLPAPVAGAVAGLFLAACYAALAGFALPTQRAMIMLAVLALGLLARRASSPLHALALAMVCVLVWHPPSVVAAGFWLSFGAVLAILATLHLAGAAAAWRKALLVQLVLSLALWPVLNAFGLPTSGVAPLANLVLVPLFGLIIVPMSLLGAVLSGTLPGVANGVFSVVGGLLDLGRFGLAQLALLPWSITSPSGQDAAVITGFVVAIGLALAPPGFPARWLALPLLLVAWLPRQPGLAEGEFELHLLDVGQGLGTVVATRRHTLVFDTGPQFQSGFSTAQAVVAPFLATRGRRRIDRLILSHGDQDHAGGVRYLLDTLDVATVISGEPGRIDVASTPCVAGQQWEWDGVAFEFLHPGAADRFAGNDASCVLRISTDTDVLLLTGDIEQRVEQLLTARNPERLRSSLVVAPHHGSRSSSSAPFVEATRPAFVLYAAGWANRYGFPADAVTRRWRDAGATGLSTATMGTISFVFHADGKISGPTSHRRAAARFWSHTGGSADAAHAVSSAD